MSLKHLFYIAYSSHKQYLLKSSPVTDIKHRSECVFNQTLLTISNCCPPFLFTATISVSLNKNKDTYYMR